MNTIKVRNIEIGSGTPKIIVPIVGVANRKSSTRPKRLILFQLIW